MKNNKIIFFLVLTLGLMNSTILNAQKNDISLLPGRWVLNSTDPNKNIFSEDPDTLEYIPYDSELTTKLHPALKWSGIRFEKDNIFFKHVWNKCATGNPPDFFEGTWIISEDKNQSFITIKVETKVREFLIYSLNKDNLVLIPKN